MRKPISEVRKSEIVDGAIASIKKNGLPFLSFDAIAQDAGMTRQLIRHYFKSADDLMVAVCERMVQVYRAHLVTLINLSDSRNRLETFLDFYFNALASGEPRKPEDDAIYDAMFATSAWCEPVKNNLVAQYTELQQVICHEIQLSYPDLDPAAIKELGHLFVSLMYGHWKMVASLGFSERLNRVTREAIDRLIASYVENYENPDDQPLADDDA